jgi:hypothetical protein
MRRVYGKLPNSNCPMRQCCANIAGTPDSVAIARYLKNFCYIPERRLEILRKYQDLELII